MLTKNMTSFFKECFIFLIFCASLRISDKYTMLHEKTVDDISTL